MDDLQSGAKVFLHQRDFAHGPNKIKILKCPIHLFLAVKFVPNPPQITAYKKKLRNNPIVCKHHENRLTYLNLKLSISLESFHYKAKHHGNKWTVYELHFFLSFAILKYIFHTKRKSFKF